MTGMEKIGEAILDKVKAEASDILKEAESRAKQEIEKAKREHQSRTEQEKKQLLQHTQEEATRIQAQANVKARQEISRAKADTIDEIIGTVRKKLAATTSTKSSLAVLLKDAIAPISGKGRAYVSAKDIDSAKKILAEDKELSARIIEVKECECSGGVIVEDHNGKIRIDDTFETRLDMLLPRLLPEIGKELFSG